MKSALRILLLSTFRVSSINYYTIILSVISRFIKYALCVVYLAQFLRYWRRQTPMTLKSWFQTGQGH